MRSPDEQVRVQLAFFYSKKEQNKRTWKKT